MEIGGELNGRYIVKGLLGEGGEGRTYLVHDKQQDQPMAVKELGQKPSDAQLAAWEKLIQLGKLPGIVQLFEIIDKEQMSYMIMEHVEGVNGVQYLENSAQGIAAAQAAGIMCPVVRGLAILHENGLLHRDVSTDNIIITNDGYGVLCDLSLICENNKDGVLEGVPRVKSGFSPEEFYIDGGRQGQWSDVYEVCATLYHLLTGQVLATAAGRGEEDPFAGFAVQLPEESLCVIRAGLEVKGEQRLDNLLPVCQILERAASGEEQQAGGSAAAIVSANAGQPYIAQNGMRTLPLNAQNVMSFNPDNAMNAKKKSGDGTGRKMITAFAMVCVLFVFFAVGVWFYNAKMDDSDGDNDSKTAKHADDDGDTAKSVEGADISLDELMELYADYLKYEFPEQYAKSYRESPHIDGYKMICLDADGLPECFVSCRYLSSGSIYYLLYYNKNTKTCEAERIKDLNDNGDMFKYAERENLFCMYYAQNSINKKTYYQFGEDGKLCLIGASQAYGDGYVVGDRWGVSLKEYEEYNNDFGELPDSFGYQDMYVSLEKAYEKFLNEYKMQTEG